jgi:hypothetical protein
MAIYVEKSDKLNLSVTDTDNPVKITVNCFNGTLVELSFYWKTARLVSCGQTIEIGTAKELKNKKIEFTGLASNPDGNNIKIEHVIFEENGNSIKYTFPDDYKGTPDLDKTAQTVTYTFTVNFL